MTKYNINLNDDIFKGLMEEKSGLKDLVEGVLNQVLEAQMTEYLNAEPYERTPERKEYRNGYRIRQFSTRVGHLTLRIPQTRSGHFRTDIFERYQRSEQALVSTMMEMVVKGVSTRKVSSIVEELCGCSYSKSTVSELCKNLDVLVKAWNERSLKDCRYPFLIFDALFTKVRWDGAVRSTTVLTAIGINESGHREILGVTLGDSESLATWDEMFNWLKERGLSGVDFVVSDEHKGLVRAVQKHFQGAIWQRCQVHFMRNVLGHTPKRLRDKMTSGLKRILRSESREEALRHFNELANQLEKQAPKAIEVLEMGLEDALSVLVLPEKYRKRMKSTNLAERVNEEIRRREKVIRIFPNKPACLRMIGALLMEQHEEWETGRKYLDMEDYDLWRQENGNVFERKVIKMV